MVKLVEMDEKVTLNTLAVARSLTMPFGSLQSTLNGLLNSPEFQSSVADLPSNTVMSPHLFKKVGVPGICLD